uniref:hypothetical protein n=1 Tax=Yoonia sp. TaxID=2212373 RepID=UPI0040486851
MAFGSVLGAGKLAGLLAGAAAGRYGFKRGWKSASKSKNQSKYRRRVGTKQAQNSGSKPWIFRPLTIARSEFRDFVYCYNGSLITAASRNIFGAEDSFKLNDPHDPAVGAAAERPLFWDQFVTLYGRYRVYNASVEIRFMTTNNSQIITCTAMYNDSTNATVLTAQRVDYALEMPNSNTRNMAPGGEHTYLIPAIKINLAKLEGEKWYSRGDSYEADTSSSPAVTPKLHIAVANGSDDGQYGSIFYQLRIVYHTRMFNPKIAAQGV